MEKRTIERNVASPPELYAMVLQTPEFLLSQPSLILPGVIWLTQLQSKFLIMDPLLIDLDFEFSQ